MEWLSKLTEQTMSSTIQMWQQQRICLELSLSDLTINIIYGCIESGMKVQVILNSLLGQHL